MEKLEAFTFHAFASIPPPTVEEEAPAQQHTQDYEASSSSAPQASNIGDGSGRYADNHTHLHIIFCRFIHVSFSCFIFAFQNTKRPKIFPFFLFSYLFGSLFL